MLESEALNAFGGLTVTLGAFLVGCMISVALSAIVGFQTFLYFQIFPTDTLPYKFLVAWIWFIDTGHTVLLCTTIWQYAVLNFARPEIMLDIVSAFPVSVLFTLIATLNANIFYAWRIHQMSKYNWWLTGPIGLLCMTRTGLGLFTAVEMMITRNWLVMAAHFKGPIIGGMAVSVATDIVISAARYYYLHDLKQGYMATQEMVDAVVIFTINDGILTCVTLIASITCFLAMPTNFIWISFYVIAPKFFANSILATLNLRNWYRHRHKPMGINLGRTQANRNTLQIATTSNKMHSSDGIPTTVEVFMDQQVEYNAPAQKYINDNGDTHSTHS
ncbi:hypothetical protein B0H14DRAFT_2881189 [Mycena olivaceomarginata]|nr:hypothetical protein B0H14DRAFT_2881189 [Mycena olivaceomarginata]